jgi:F-type H+-transporting ATPase subunit b
MAILANAFSLITPDFGLFFWTMLTFVILWIVLGKFAFKPINNSLRERADNIADALKKADQAKEEMAALQAGHEKMLAEASEERSRIIAEARQTAATLVEEAREQATSEKDRIVAQAGEEIHNQKMAALVDVKNQAGKMALDIAEKVIRRELGQRESQEAYVKDLVNEYTNN